jgi:chromosome segregation ATPase
MSGTDFFDDDLVRQRDSAKRIKMGPGDEPAEPMSGATSDLGGRGLGELNLTRMARHRKEVDNQASVATQELDRLRKRQEQLEAEKRELEDLRRKQEDFERGKRDMLDHLKHSLVGLERREVETQRLAELLSSSRTRFRELLEDLESIKEEAWSEDMVREELGKSLVVIEDARTEYNKAMAKIEASKGDGATPASAQPAVLFEERYQAHEEEKSFSHWVKVGLAVSLPLIASMVLIAIVFIVVFSMGLI